MRNLVKVMKNRLPLGVGALAVLIMILGCVQGGLAAELTPITLKEALDMAFQQNTSHALFLWEQDLAQQREILKKHPQVKVKADPASIKDGELQEPTGSLSLSMPLGKNLDLHGTVTIGVHTDGVAVDPSGSLTLDYQFFALPDQPGGHPTPEENRQKQSNSLVLQTVDLLVKIRQQLDLRSYEVGRLKHLEDSLEAARLTPNYDDLELKKQQRDQAAKLATMQEELDQLQLKLITILGIAEIWSYDPMFAVVDISVGLEAELETEVFAANSQLRQAQAELTLAQDTLDLERKSRGWDVQASGGAYANEAKTGLTWNVGLSATKTLYPRRIMLEELELAVVKATHALEMQESALRGELRGAIQGVRAAQDQVELRAEQLGDAREDLALRQRQYEAGLVTRLQLQDTTLALEKAQLDYDHGKMLYAQNILVLWDLCGRELQTMVYEVIN